MSAVPRSAVCALLAIAASLSFATSAAAAIPASHGQFVHIARPRTNVNANQSSNWFGYNQGTLEQGGKQFHAIAGEWTVPTASQRVKGESESSSDWIGIGGGCIDAGCTAGDNTLIQTGTEQDVDSSGSPSYSAWYELVPAPSTTIPNMTVKPGDLMSARIAETSTPEVWSITLDDVTRGESFSTTLPYSSDYSTAEWIEEVPVVISGVSSGIAPLPKLSTTAFDHAATNGGAANLSASEEMELTDQNNNVIGTPSAPDGERDGFNLCAWTTSCAAPATTSGPATGTSGNSGARGRRSAGSGEHVTIRSRIVRVRGRRAQVRLWSSAASHGTIKLVATAGPRRKKVVVGQASFDTAAGRGQVVDVRLSNRALHLLGLDRTLKAVAAVRATDLSGDTTNTRTKLTLKRPRARR